MARKTGRQALWIVLPVALLTTCTPHIDFPQPGGPPPADVVVKQRAVRAPRPAGPLRATAMPVDVRYLGSGGFLIRRDTAVLMTAPLFTNPFPLAHLSHLVASQRLIKAFVDDVNEFADGTGSHEFENDVKDVSIILSGHAHYDHLMDVPEMVRMYMTANAPYIVTNTTGRRIMAPLQVANVVAINDPSANFVNFKDAAHCRSNGCETPDEPGKWWPGDQGTSKGRIRVYAVSSDHPPQLFGMLFFPGCQRADLAAAPTKFGDWKMGEVLAFLIDLLDTGGNVAFRIYYEDAPLPPCRSQAFKDRVDGDNHAVDLAILCAGNFNEVPGAETIVKKLRAQNVVLAHWEWFFDETRYRDRIFLELPPPNSVKQYRDLVLAQLQGVVSEPEKHIHVPLPGVRLTF
jgi:hypothetical protein